MSSGRTWVDTDIPRAVGLVRERIQLILRGKQFSIGIDGGKPENMPWKVCALLSHHSMLLLRLPPVSRQVVAAIAMSPEFGEVLLELLILYGDHEDSDKQAAFLNGTISTANERLVAIRALQMCQSNMKSADRALGVVVETINRATDKYVAECEAAGVAVPISATRQSKAGERASFIDTGLGGESNLADAYTLAYSAVLAARRKVTVCGGAVGRCLQGHGCSIISCCPP